MRQWNLSSLDELQEPVVLRTPDGTTRTPGSARRVRVRPIKMAIQVAALSVATFVITATGSSLEFFIPASQGVVADNAGRDKPPLDEVFANRFTAEWSRENEQNLLAAMVSNTKKVIDPDQELLNLVHSSQQESLRPEVARLSNKAALAVLRRKA